MHILERLYYSGGIERILAQKANWLVQNSQYEVTILTFSQKEDQDDYFPLDEKVKRIRLSIDSPYFKKDLRTKLNNWLKDNPQDVCISTYGREFGILPDLKDRSKKIIGFHFCYDINKHWAAKNSNSILFKLRGTIETMKMTRIAKKYDNIVVLTNSDKKSGNWINLFNEISG